MSTQLSPELQRYATSLVWEQEITMVTALDAGDLPAAKAAYQWLRNYTSPEVMRRWKDYDALAKSVGLI